jgi:hypothetical protein
LGVLACLLPGCYSAQKILHYPFVHVKYRNQGVSVWDIQQRFEYDAYTNTETLNIGRDLLLVDSECDGKVDRIESGDEVFLRGQTGADELFRRADVRWGFVREYLLASWFRSRRAGLLRNHPEKIVPGLKE